MVSRSRGGIHRLRLNGCIRRRKVGPQRQSPGGNLRYASYLADEPKAKKKKGKPMTESEKQLRKILAERVAILDGAMGTMIQSYKVDEQAFRGAQFADHSHDLKGCNDVLCITKPDLVADIHVQYLEAGADIIETNTFNSTSVSMADYHLESVVYDLNFAGARAAKKAVDRVMAKDPTRPRFVAGAMGPTNRTCSISTDVHSAATRGVTYE